jgi:hypothetical protein
VEVTESVRKAGLPIANAPLHSVASATTVRARGVEAELTDGPFAVTEEVLRPARRKSFSQIIVRPKLAW